MLELDPYECNLASWCLVSNTKHPKFLNSWGFLNLKICAIKWKICSEVQYNGKDSEEQMNLSNFISGKLSLWKYKKDYQSVFVQSNKLTRLSLLHVRSTWNRVTAIQHCISENLVRHFWINDVSLLSCSNFVQACTIPVANAHRRRRQQPRRGARAKGAPGSMGSVGGRLAAASDVTLLPGFAPRTPPRGVNSPPRPRMVNLLVSSLSWSNCNISINYFKCNNVCKVDVALSCFWKKLKTKKCIFVSELEFVI